MTLLRKTLLVSACLSSFGAALPAHALDYEDYPIVKLRTLDKITARTMTFEAKVGATMKFGEIFIKVQTCRKPPPVQKSEASAFLQIWETDSVKDQSRWIFSGWMFGSSPTLSAMDHPVYDVWVIDCLGKDPEALPPPETLDDAAILPPGKQPDQPPAEQLGEHGESAPVPETPASPDASPDAAQDDGAVEETVPTSNMPADAVPTEPQTETVDPVAPVTPRAADPEPAPAPVAPAPESHDSFQGIY